ncbi:hypothetical protein RFI_22639 [Reticulomyxa filosa]|uniref:Uncharacterized protein n=1 Tax=Reticulomyxa filosa TaxID=46433 RepID=X6ML37_RETFI|nr:hypothetical protein RFI_22639 [Reticulomyxa filosa]|eukprot:ETO14728.1 hypothetical protein RFI_22639 [Reticulomyxa filosa]
MKEVYNFVQQHRNMLNIVIVYTKEEHASDEWSLPNNYDIATHRVLKDRLKASEIFKNEFSYWFETSTNGFVTHLLMDNMSDEMAVDFNSTPDRLFLVDNTNMKIVYRSIAGPFGALKTKPLIPILQKLR